MIINMYDLNPTLSIIRQLPITDLVLCDMDDGSLVLSLCTDNMEIVFTPNPMEKGDCCCECCIKE